MTLSQLASVFRAEVKSHVGIRAENLMPRREPTFADVQELYPDGPSLASALGLGAPGRHKPGTTAWRRRRNLLDDYSRWRRGGRNPFAGSHAGRLRSVVRTAWRKAATPASQTRVLEMMAEHGITVYSFIGHFNYEPDRERVITAKVYVSPSVFEESGFAAAVAGIPPTDWDHLARAALNAWARAYGLDDDFQEEIDQGGAFLTGLAFDLGRDPFVDYDYGA